MYDHLEAPPPPSQLRHTLSQGAGPRGRYSGPWSPEYGPESSTRSHVEERRSAERARYYPPLDEFPRLPTRRRKEASEMSVEALDLADYARTLSKRTTQADHPYPPFPLAPPAVETSTNVRSTDLWSPHPPSFPNFTRRDTRSSVNTSTTATHATPHSTHSLPAFLSSSRRRPLSVPTTPYRSAPDVAEGGGVTQCPPPARDWYSSNAIPFNPRAVNNDSNMDRLEAYELEAGFAPPRALMAASSTSRHSHTSHDPPAAPSPFDPAYIHPNSYPRGWQSEDHSYPSHSAPTYSNHGHDHREGVVPWSHDPPEYHKLPLDPAVKEERIRMLEQEFGDTSKKSKGHRDSGKVEVDDGLLRTDDGKVAIGTPDGKGGLATHRPLLRIVFRWIQFSLVAAAGGPVIWAGVKLKPDPAPPPAGKPPFYILAVLAPVTFVLLCYLFVIRPCTTRRRHTSAVGNPAARGMMVLPFNGSKGKGGKDMKLWKKPGRKGRFGGRGQDVQVNLIVDPSAFGPTKDDLTSSDSEDDDGGWPGGGGPAAYFNKHKSPEARAKEKARRKRTKRRTLLASLKLEEEWRRARRWLRLTSFIDAAAGAVWGVAFGFVIAGQRCPTGGEEKGYGGWCVAYNASTAAACLLCVAFFVSVYFDVKDLYASKASPRTRV